MTQKTHDLAVKLGEYTNNQGETKARWKNIGSVLRFDDKGTGILLDRTFNPAGVPNPDGRDTVLISVFPVKDRNQQPQQPPAQNNLDDDIPF